MELIQQFICIDQVVLILNGKRKEEESHPFLQNALKHSVYLSLTERPVRNKTPRNLINIFLSQKHIQTRKLLCITQTSIRENQGGTGSWERGEDFGPVPVACFHDGNLVFAFSSSCGKHKFIRKNQFYPSVELTKQMSQLCVSLSLSVKQCVCVFLKYYEDI